MTSRTMLCLRHVLQHANLVCSLSVMAARA